jgi:hypothetical protein
MNSCLTLSSYSGHQIIIVVAIIYYTIKVSITCRLVTFIFLIFCEICVLHPPFKFSSLRHRYLGLLRTRIWTCIFVKKHNFRKYHFVLAFCSPLLSVKSLTWLWNHINDSVGCLLQPWFINLPFLTISQVICWFSHAVSLALCAIIECHDVQGLWSSLLLRWRRNHVVETLFEFIRILFRRNRHSWCI